MNSFVNTFLKIFYAPLSGLYWKTDRWRTDNIRGFSICPYSGHEWVWNSDDHCTVGIRKPETLKHQTFWCPVFEWGLKTGPFGNQPNVDHSKTGHVRFLDPHCIFVLISVVPSAHTRVTVRTSYVFMWWEFITMTSPSPASSARRASSSGTNWRDIPVLYTIKTNPSHANTASRWIDIAKIEKSKIR